MSRKLLFCSWICILFMVFIIVISNYAEETLSESKGKIEKTTVSGYVTDVQGKSITGAKIILIDPFERGSQRFYSETLSDKKGQFSLDAPPSKCRVFVYADGYASMHLIRLVTEGENRGWNFTLPKSAHVSGKILDTKGNLAPKRILELSPIKGRAPLPPGYDFNQTGAQGLIETDENGGFDIPNLAPGKYSITVRGSSPDGAKGFYQEPLKGGLLKVKSGDRMENFEITVNSQKDYIISGHVRDAKGNPIRKVYVSTSIAHGSPWWCHTNEDGFYCIEGLDGMNLDSFRVEFRGTNANCERFELAIPDVPLNSRNMEIIVPEKGDINGMVLSSTNEERIKTFQVTVPFVKLSENGAIWENPPVEITQSQDGGFRISGVPAGDVIVEVKSERFGSQRFSTTMKAGRTCSIECAMLDTEVSNEPQTLGGRFLQPLYPGDSREAGELWAMPATDGRLRISPLRQWSLTGLTLEKGQILDIVAEGFVQGCQGSVDDWAYGPWGPEGGPAKDDPGSRVCALIGRIVGGKEIYEFIVGEIYQLEIPLSGQLELGVSDIWHWDNSGEFFAEIQVDGIPVDFSQHKTRMLTNQTENLVPSMKSMNGAEINYLDETLLISSRRLEHRSMILTDEKFTPPLEIRTRARTDSTNIRLYYGSFGMGQLIFNWEVQPNELRIHDPATGGIKGIPGMGWIEEDEFHDIIWRIGLQRMQILVDGEERYKGNGEYRDVVSPVGIGSALGSSVDVESIVITPLDQAVMDAPVVVATAAKNDDYRGDFISQAGIKTKLVDPDDLVGWFKLPSRNERHRVIQGNDTLIPILKKGGNYYTISWPGAEVPLKPCPEGLEWGFTPSGMQGTTIAFDKASDSYSIIIVDRIAMSMSDMSNPEWQPLTKIDKPSWVLNTKARRPRTNDDFLGWYQFVWLPIRYEIKKEGEKYIVSEQISPEPGKWTNHEDPRELKSLPDRMGFVMHERERINLMYNEELKRFELVFQSNKDSSDFVRIPLACIPVPPSAEVDAVPAPPVRVGIPSWH